MINIDKKRSLSDINILYMFTILLYIRVDNCLLMPIKNQADN